MSRRNPRKRTKATEYSNDLVTLVGRYQRGELSRRDFLERVPTYAVGGLTTVAMLNKAEANVETTERWAQQAGQGPQRGAVVGGITPEKKTVLDWIEQSQGRISDFHQLIWNYAEPALREYKSAKAYRDLLEAEGFEVTEGTGGMPTAFMATFGEGKPVIGSFAEYDAVPDMSQKNAPYEAPRDGLSPYAAGHTDPHSALGVGAVFGILAAKEAMKKHNLKGTLKFFGEPGEKICASKPIHAARGYYDDFDAFICYHPSSGSNTVHREIHFGSYWSCVFIFECLDAETWSSPEVNAIGLRSRPPAALDAVCMMYSVTKSTEEAMLPHTGSWTLNGFIQIGGQCTSDNLPPRISAIQYAWRSSNLDMQQQIYRVLENNARHVAAINHCKFGIRWVSKTRVGLPNLAMTDLVWRNMLLAGPIHYGEDAKKVCREIQRNCGLEPMPSPIREECETLTSPQGYDAMRRHGMPAWQQVSGSDDYVEYCWYSPTARFWTSKAFPRSPYPGYGYPRWVSLALGGIPSTIDPAIFLASKTLGASLVELLTEPGELKKAQEEFKERTGGGQGGKNWVGPLFPPDIQPPVDLRWPEYTDTIRGHEWWIPTQTR